jgi:Cu(I)/Ag(I) efflux system membrane fusion protein
MKNSNKRTGIIAFGALAIGLILGWLFFGRSNVSKDELYNHSAIAESETVFTCSMHPQVRRNEPGDCPICGMDLIPLESTDGELDPMAVRMSPTAMQLAQVQTMVVSEGDAEKSIRMNGKVQVDERLLFTQSSHIPGRVEKLMVNFTGDFVAKGQVIAHIYSPDLVTAQEELFEAQKIKETQPALFDAAKEKLKNWKLSENQIAEILASNKVLEQFPILANVSGHVTNKMVNLGDYIKQGEAIYKIADLSKVWVLFDVYESDMAWIKKGDKVTYTIQSLPGKTFEGTISYVDPLIDPKTRVAQARVETSNRDLLLKPEMFASGSVASEIKSKDSTIVVPKTAVMWTGKRSVVYIMQTTEQGVSFRMREVTLGPGLGNSYVIESGLETGEEIAVNGTFSIDAAAQLAGKPSMMNPEGGVAMTGHNHGGATDKKMENMPEASKQAPVSNEVKKALQPLFDNYFNMKEALADDDYEKAKKAGIAVNTALGKVDMKLFEGDEHTLWMQQSAMLKKSTTHIAQLADIEALRENFIGVSNAMIAVAESFDPVSSTVYLQHCPMADSNKGADWLSQKKEILNPYFGSAMLKCGETKRLINK